MKFKFKPDFSRLKSFFNFRRFFRSKKGVDTVISIDLENRLIHYYSISNADKNGIVYDSASLKARALDNEFYQKFTAILQEFNQKYPSLQSANITVVLPDSVIVTDTLTVPTINNTLRSTLNATINGIYKNRTELRVNTYSATQNKQYATCCLTILREDIITSLKLAFSTTKLPLNNITFAANTTANAVESISSRLKSMTYLLLDIKENFSRFVFVFKGRAIGFYSLPFGHQILTRNRLASEDMLFNHSVAELAVINARERSRAKQLTVSDGDNIRDSLPDNDPNSENYNGSVSENDVLSDNALQYKSQTRKTPRKLPKFMLRPTPETEKDVAYENFRIFVKWALNLIQSNDKITAIGNLDAVYVNMPSGYEFLFEMTNLEQKENGIRFVNLAFNKEKEIITRNLELYGGIFAKQLNKTNNF